MTQPRSSFSYGVAEDGTLKNSNTNQGKILEDFATNMESFFEHSPVVQAISVVLDEINFESGAAA